MYVQLYQLYTFELELCVLVVARVERRARLPLLQRRLCSMRGASALVFAAVLAAAVPRTRAEDCYDRNIDCGEWAEEGQCDDAETRSWMLEHCMAACGLCPAEVKRRRPPRAPSRAPSRGSAPEARAEL